MIKVRPARDVPFREDEEKNGHTGGQNNMEMKGALRNCFMDVRKMWQILRRKTKNFSINFQIACTIHCWYEGVLISP